MRENTDSSVYYAQGDLYFHVVYVIFISLWNGANTNKLINLYNSLTTQL